MAKNKSKLESDGHHFKSALDVLLFYMPKRFRRPVSAFILFAGLVVTIYTVRSALNDIFYRFIIWKPYSVEFVSSQIDCDKRTEPRDWRDILAYWETKHTLKIKIINNLKGDPIVIDSIRLSYMNHALSCYREIGETQKSLDEIQPDRIFTYIVPYNPNDCRLSQDSLAIKALLDGEMYLNIYSSIRKRTINIPYFEFFDNQEKLIHVLGNKPPNGTSF